MTDQPQHLFLIRHGQTALNTEGRLRGLANPPLDEVGRVEAEATAIALTGRGIDTVYCSPLERALRTAQIIAHHLDCGFDVVPEFNDRDYGPWTGQVKAAVVSQFGSVDAAPGVESTDHVLKRVWPAIDRAMNAHAGVPIAVVTHDALIRPILTTIDPRIGSLEVRTGSWNELVRRGSMWTVLKHDQNPELAQR